jgi:magnesium-transporting ATPase (P-type)
MRWDLIRVGDIIRVDKDDQVPADILCINAPSDSKNIVFISTMNLDGETNLKDKVIPFEKLQKTYMSSFHGSINCNIPNEFLDYWDGNVDSKDYNINCSIKNVLLRGCTLKNTEYVYGIVIYVGNDTKIMQNSKKPLRKISNMMKMMNNILYSVFAFQICLVLLFAGLSLAWTQGNAQDHDYLNLNPKVSFVTLVV